MTEAQWIEKIGKFLIGKTVKSVSYLSEKETKALGWYSRALVIEFEDGSQIIPSQDDEGNGPGALFTSDKDLPVIPVI